MLYPLSYGRNNTGTLSVACLCRFHRSGRCRQAGALCGCHLPRMCNVRRRTAAWTPAAPTLRRAGTMSATGSRARASLAHDGSASPAPASDTPPRAVDRGGADCWPPAAPETPERAPAGSSFAMSSTAARRPDTGSSRAPPVFFAPISTARTKSVRFGTFTSDHCNASNSPRRQPVSTAAIGRARSLVFYPVVSTGYQM